MKLNITFGRKEGLVNYGDTRIKYEISNLYKTRTVFPTAKFCKEELHKVFNVSTKSHFSNFQVGWKTFPWPLKALLVFLKKVLIISGPVKSHSI